MQSEIAIFKKLKNEKVGWAVILKDMNECLPEGMWVTDLSYNQDNIIQLLGGRIRDKFRKKMWLLNINVDLLVV